MGFSVKISAEQGYHVISLKDESSNCEAAIYSFGALLNAFSINTPERSINVVDGFSSPADAIKNIAAGFNSAKLSPFVCRLDKGEYSFAGVHHKIRKHYLGDEAIHGLLYNAVFDISDYKETDEHATVTLSYTYNNNEEGFPYAYEMMVEYMLGKNNQLTVTTKVKNTGDRNFPLSDGWHPYFTLGETVNDLSVQFNADQMVEFDERLLPTGMLLHNNKFAQSTPFGETFLDNCFVLKDFENDSCVLRDENSGLQLTIKAGQSYPYLQVYTPPHRKSIAVENLSSPPDAFNNGMSLIIAKPGETYNFSTSYILQLVTGF
ncbi:MAG TPA: aldose 1-epimerase [Panacibacter sp.]|nr:aldose 1-epimerase [Panacibacter sp.]HNP43176.1 aldose 1-epimerase [Panacibacter sp.]